MKKKAFMKEQTLKKINRSVFLLFLADLLSLLGYEQARQHQQTTFTCDRTLFYWFYLFPLAFLLGGYLLGQLILRKSGLFLLPKTEKVLFFCITSLLTVYFAISVLLTVDHFLPFLPRHITTALYYPTMIVFTKCLLVFLVFGILLSLCVCSHNKRED